MEQLSIFDLLPKEKKVKAQILKPSIPKCSRSCKNYSTTLPDGTTDRYVTGQPRCVHMDFDKKCLIINNIWYPTCKNYLPKEG